MQVALNPFTGQLQLIGDQPLLGTVALNLPTGGAPATATVTLGAGLAGANRYIVNFAYLRLETAMLGAGTVTARVGNVAGGDQLLLDWAITAALAQGDVWGLLLTSLGVDFDPLAGYLAPYPAAQQIHLTLTPVGVVTAGRVVLYLFGMKLL